MRHVLVLLAGLASCGSDHPAAAATTAGNRLVFSALPDQDETRLREKYTPVAAFLEQRLGVPVHYVHATSYKDLVDHFKNGDVHLAWFGGLTGVQARAAVPGARAIAQGAEDPSYYSYFIAHRSTGLTRSDEFPIAIAGKKFTFGSEGSTSGRLMPEHFIREHTGRTPKDLFGRENHYAGSHDETITLVESGAFEVGVVNYKVYERRVREHTTDPEVCRVIWRTPPYADYNFTAHPALEQMFGAGFLQRVQQALLGMNDRNLLAAFERSRFIAARNEDFAAIEQLARQLEFVR